MLLFLGYNRVVMFTQSVSMLVIPTRNKWLQKSENAKTTYNPSICQLCRQSHKISGETTLKPLDLLNRRRLPANYCRLLLLTMPFTLT